LVSRGLCLIAGIGCETSTQTLAPNEVSGAASVVEQSDGVLDRIHFAYSFESNIKGTSALLIVLASSNHGCDALHEGKRIANVTELIFPVTPNPMKAGVFAVTGALVVSDSACGWNLERKASGKLVLDSIDAGATGTFRVLLDDVEDISGSFSALDCGYYAQADCELVNCGGAPLQDSCIPG
jgi:hypothetical protein